eukprot:2442031-Pleurochrysis_carterae.AAC.8
MEFRHKVSTFDLFVMLYRPSLGCLESHEIQHQHCAQLQEPWLYESRRVSALHASRLHIRDKII